MFAMVLPVPRTSISLGGGAECFLAHAGSASMASGLRLGAFPVKVTVPVTDEAAKARPGQTDIATSPAASHTLFPVARMLGSLVIRKSRFRRYDRCCIGPAWSGQTLHPARRPCNPPRTARRA